MNNETTDYELLEALFDGGKKQSSRENYVSNMKAIETARYGWRVANAYSDAAWDYKNGIPREKFIWYIYTKSKKLFPDMKPANLTRLMYLATYMWYDGRLVDGRRNSLTAKQLLEKMMLSRKSFQQFYEDMKQRGILTEDANAIYLNADLFKRGVLPQGYLDIVSKNGDCITKLYVRSIRFLYEHSSRTSDKTLSYLFQMTPFIHYKSNILCWNPFENDPKLIRYMTIEEFAEQIGFDKHNIKNLYCSLFKPRFELNGVMYKAVVGVDVGDHIFRKFTVMMNPRLCSACHKSEFQIDSDIFIDNKEVCKHIYKSLR